MQYTLRDLIEWTGGRLANQPEGLAGGALEAIAIDGPSALGVSRAGHVAFFFSREYERELATAAPGALIVGEPFVEPLKARMPELWRKTAVVACADPYGAMAIVSEKFALRVSAAAKPRGGTGVHVSAVVDSTAELGEAVSIGAHCVVEAGARIGARAVVYPGCYVGPGARIGEDCVLFPNVTLYEWVELGARVRVHAGAVLGADGFGYAPVREGGKTVGHRKIYHLGRVIVGDDVEIGANTCIDRGTFGDTILERGAKVDNLVQMGHNTRLDEGAVVCGGVCMAGNTRVGRYATVAGVTGIANNVTVGDGATVGACSLLSKDVPAGAMHLGNPQREYHEHFRAHAALNRLVRDAGRGPGQRKKK